MVNPFRRGSRDDDEPSDPRDRGRRRPDPGPGSGERGRFSRRGRGADDDRAVPSARRGTKDRDKPGERWVPFRRNRTDDDDDSSVIPARPTGLYGAPAPASRRPSRRGRDAGQDDKAGEKRRFGFLKRGKKEDDKPPARRGDPFDGPPGGPARRSGSGSPRDAQRRSPTGSLPPRERGAAPSSLLRRRDEDDDDDLIPDRYARRGGGSSPVSPFASQDRGKSPASPWQQRDEDEDDGFSPDRYGQRSVGGGLASRDRRPSTERPLGRREQDSVDDATPSRRIDSPFRSKPSSLQSPARDRAPDRRDRTPSRPGIGLPAPGAKAGKKPEEERKRRLPFGRRSKGVKDKDRDKKDDKASRQLPPFAGSATSRASRGAPRSGAAAPARRRSESPPARQLAPTRGTTARTSPAAPTSRRSRKPSQPAQPARRSRASAGAARAEPRPLPGGREKGTFTVHQGLDFDRKIDLIGVGLLMFAMVSFFSVIPSVSLGLLPEPTAGFTGALNHLLSQLFGWGKIVWPMVTFGVGVWLMVKSFEDTGLDLDYTRIVGGVMLYTCVLAWLQMIELFDNVAPSVEAFRPISYDLAIEQGRGGGWVGHQVYLFLLSQLLDWGTVSVLFAWLIMGLMLTFDLTVVEIIGYAARFVAIFRVTPQERARRRAAREMLRAEIVEAMRPKDATPQQLPLEQVAAVAGGAGASAAAASASRPAAPDAPVAAEPSPPKAPRIARRGALAAQDADEAEDAGTPRQRTLDEQAPSRPGVPASRAPRLTASGAEPVVASPFALTGEPLERPEQTSPGEEDSSGEPGERAARVPSRRPLPHIRNAARAQESAPASADKASRPASAPAAESGEADTGRRLGFLRRRGAAAGTPAAEGSPDVSGESGAPLDDAQTADTPDRPPFARLAREADTKEQDLPAIPVPPGRDSADAAGGKPDGAATTGRRGRLGRLFRRGVQADSASAAEPGESPAGAGDATRTRDEDAADAAKPEEKSGRRALGLLGRRGAGSASDAPPDDAPSARGEPDPVSGEREAVETRPEPSGETAPDRDRVPGDVAEPRPHPAPGDDLNRTPDRKPAGSRPVRSPLSRQDEPQQDRKGSTPPGDGVAGAIGAAALAGERLKKRDAETAPASKLPGPPRRPEPRPTAKPADEPPALEEEDDGLEHKPLRGVSPVSRRVDPGKRPARPASPFAGPPRKPSPDGGGVSEVDAEPAESAGSPADARPHAAPPVAGKMARPARRDLVRGRERAPQAPADAREKSREGTAGSGDDPARKPAPASKTGRATRPAEPVPQSVLETRPAPAPDDVPVTEAAAKDTKAAANPAPQAAGVRPPAESSAPKAPPVGAVKASRPAGDKPGSAGDGKPGVARRRSSSKGASRKPSRSRAAASGSKREDAASRTAEQVRPQKASYELPDFRRLLNRGDEQRVNDEVLLDKARVIEDTLASFNAPGKVVEVNPGPVITQFGIEPDYLITRSGKKQRVKVNAIARLDADLALALAAKTIRIEAPVPGKSMVGIEVPNDEVTLVSLLDIMEAPEFTRIDSKLRIALGLAVDGTPVAADLTSMPHLLIAGTTGSGKSVCVNAIITCLLLQNTPDDLQFIMVDPKRVELTGYNGIPHLVAPVVVELERIVGVLQWVQREMEARYHKFASLGARNILDYNNKIGPGEKRMPYYVVVVDELADLMMLAPDETERLLARLAQMARATGIHLIISTQRPSVDIITGMIKANFPARVAFMVASSVDSRVILDQPGAEKLLGRGDMLYQSPDAAAPLRMQGVFVSDEEITRITSFWKSQLIQRAGPDALTSPHRDFNLGAGGDNRRSSRGSRRRSSRPAQQAFWDDAEMSGAGGEDELYGEAVEVVQSLRKASISLLQRQLRIGYTRAARLIDRMEEEGIIGPPQEGSKPREVIKYD